MMQILKYDLKQSIRENIFVIIMIFIFTGIYFPSFSTMNEKYLPLILNIYGICIVFSLLDLLNKGIHLQIIIDFPKDTIFFLQYLSFKFQFLALIIFPLLLCVMKIFFSVNLFHLISFYITVVYLSLGYYYFICLYYGKRTNLSFIDVLSLSFILLFALAGFKILFYLIEFWIVLPILSIVFLFNLLIIKKISQIIAPIIFDILENHHEGN